MATPLSLVVGQVYIDHFNVQCAAAPFAAFVHENGPARAHTAPTPVSAFGPAIGQRQIPDGDGAILQPENARSIGPADGQAVDPTSLNGHVVGDDQKWANDRDTTRNSDVDLVGISGRGGCIGVGIQNGLPQRPRPAVGGSIDHKRTGLGEPGQQQGQSG